MKLLIVVITYNRLNCTKRTLKELKETITVPHYLVVSDNNSTDGTKEWLKTQEIDLVIENPENYYPGKATNIGWERGLKHYPEATHLMRVDNDSSFSKGWDKKAIEYFKAFPELGQLGLEHTAIEDSNAHTQNIEATNGMVICSWPGNVGGLNIIKREIWDKGIHYNEDRWSHKGSNVPTPQEDARFSFDIRQADYLFGHMTEDLARTFVTEEDWKDDKEYYRKVMEERGYKDIHKELFDE